MFSSQQSSGTPRDWYIAVHFFNLRTDLVCDHLEFVGVHSVEVRGRKPQNSSCLVLRYLLETLLQPEARVRKSALRVRKIVAPHQIAEPDVVPAINVVFTRRRGSKEAISIEIVTGLHREFLAKGISKLAGVVPPDPFFIHLPNLVGHPPRGVFGHGVHEFRVPFEQPTPNKDRQRSGRPPACLGRINRKHAWAYPYIRWTRS